MNRMHAFFSIEIERFDFLLLLIEFIHFIYNLIGSVSCMHASWKKVRV